MTDVAGDSADMAQINQIGDHIRQALALVDSFQQPLLGAKLHDCLVHVEQWIASLGCGRA